MESAARLLNDLSAYEDKWACTAAAKARSGLLRANGTVQFVSLQPAKKGSIHVPAPVVVAIGINYDQGANPSSLLRWLRDEKGVADGVSDCYWLSGSDMRTALDCALDAWRKNPSAWMHPICGQAHASAMPPSWNDYILIATNLSPFITDKQWTGLRPSEQRALRAAWSSSSHLDDLAALLHERVDLWVGHGIDHVWSDFLKWVARHRIRSWQLSYNLSAQGLANMKRARASKTHVRHMLFA
jgi:hypothetical protein